MQNVRCLPAIIVAVAAAVPAARGEETYYVSRGADWSYFKGTQEASNPIDAWRMPAFEASSWLHGPAPIGYGEPVFDTAGTRLADMLNNYTTVFLRRTFQVGDAAAVAALHLDCNYDDGFVAWINGTEVLRLNVYGAPGDPVTYDMPGTPEAREYGTPFTAELPDPASYVVQGTNVLAVFMCNRSLSSSDLYFDCALFDPFGPDTNPPAIAARVPASGAVVRLLSQVTVTFDEPVAGVDAGDLLIGGSPAASASGQGPGPYVFACAPQPDGLVEVRFADGHGITDLAVPPNPFAGASWTCTVDSTLPPVDVEISEFLAANRTGLTDQDGDYEDWIEIHNRGADAVSLAGWALTDEPDEPGKWVFPAVTLPADAYLVVFASGKDRRPDAGELHTSFKLDSSGEYLGLFTADSPRQAAGEYAPQFPPQRSDYSYGLNAAGETGYFDPPTPRAPNDALALFNGFCADPAASIPAGLKEGTQHLAVELACPTPGAEIFYTLDASEPSRTNGLRYAGPLDLYGATRSPSRIVRAVAYAPGLLPSNHVTFSYVFVAYVPTQAADPLGFPSTWPNAPAADYAMDPEIAGNAAYASLIAEGLRSLATVSIVCDFDDLFNAVSGIYANPTQEGIAWERAASAELFQPDGRTGFRQNCGLRIQGGASRTPEKSPKHSFRLIFRGDYGATRLRCALFPDSRVSSFDTIVLRAGFNNSWIHWDSAQRLRSQYLRDQWARDAVRDMGRPSSHGFFVNLYLNGVYWGLYNICERPSAPFAAAYLGGDSEDYDALNAGVPVDGDKTAWNQMMAVANAGLSSLAQYEALQGYLDVPGFIDYMLVNIYGANQDWPHQNYYAARRREPGAQYRLFAWDSERTLESATTDGLARLVPANGDLGTLFTRLKENAEYRLLFADRAHRHLMNGGVLTPQACDARWTALAGKTDAAAAAESARWGDYRRDVHPYSVAPYLLYTRNDHWLPEQTRLRTQYFPQRTATVLAQLRGAGLYPAIGAPIFSRHGGVIAAGYPLVITLPAGTTGTIYFTTDGADPRVYGTGAAAPSASPYSSPIVLDDPTHVKARTLYNGAWSALTEAVFTIPRPLDAVRITEIMYHPPEGGAWDADAYEFLELRNTGAAVLDVSGVRIGDGIDYVFPEGTILEPGAFVVLAVDAGAFAARYPGVPLLGVYRRNLSNGGDTLVLYGPEGEVLESVTYLDASPWPVEADGAGYSLVPSGDAEDPNDPLYWRPSTFWGGSPGEADPSPSGDAPRITAGPEDASVLEGEPAAFAVAVAGTPPFLYQWQRNGSNVAGATAADYVIPHAAPADDGARFRCVVRNAGGTAVSVEAILLVTALRAPVFLAHPLDALVAAGDRVEFTVFVDASPAPSYQWQRNGADIPGANGSSYVIPAAGPADNGATFRCVCANAAGTATSDTAMLVVLADETQFSRGDANGSGTLDISDAVTMLGYLFSGKAAGCVKACDTNDDGKIDIADPVALLAYLFASGRSPAAPFGACGSDPTSDGLTCERFPPCE